MANSVREEDIISIKNQTNMSIKDKKGAYEFKNSNLRFHGMKMDINGNPCFVLSTPNQRAFSVQQDPAYTIYWELGQSGESIVEKNYKDSDDFEKYIVDYIKKFGSKKQKSNLHVYNEDNRKIGFYTDNKGNKAVYTMSYDESDNECELTKVKDGKKTLVARTKIFSNGKITTSHKGGYDLENCDELHKDYFDFVEKHIKKDNNFACGKGSNFDIRISKDGVYTFRLGLVSKEKFENMKKTAEMWNDDFRKWTKFSITFKKQGFDANGAFGSVTIKSTNDQMVYDLLINYGYNRGKNQFSIIDDTKDVLRAGGKLAGNIVKDTLYNGGILMF